MRPLGPLPPAPAPLPPGAPGYPSGAPNPGLPGGTQAPLAPPDKLRARTNRPLAPSLPLPLPLPHPCPWPHPFPGPPASTAPARTSFVPRRGSGAAAPASGGTGLCGGQRSLNSLRVKGEAPRAGEVLGLAPPLRYASGSRGGRPRGGGGGGGRRGGSAERSAGGPMRDREGEG